MWRRHMFLNMREDFWASHDGIEGRATAQPDAMAPSPVQYVVENPSDVIPGDTSTPYTLAVGGSETGVVNFVGDHDWFAITLVAGQSYAFTMTGSGSLSDTYLELCNSAGALLAIDDDGIAPGGGSLLRFTATASGTYYLNARAYEDTGVSNTGPYTVTAAVGPPQNPLDTIDLHYTAPLHIDVYFATSGQTFNGVTASRSWLQNEKDAAMAALATWAAVTPLTFSISATSTGAEFILSLASLGSGVLGQFGTTNGIGYGDFAPNGYGWTTQGLLPGGAGFTTLVHEFGHGLGLAHPHDNGGGSEIMQGVLGPFGSYGTYLMDQGVFTVMSYNDGWALQPGGAAATATSGNEATPGPLDIALAQIKYGINSSTNSGDSTYVLAAADGAYKAIWDTGGNDTISFSGSASATIDLRTATLQNQIGGGGFVSFVSGIAGGYTIANGAVIENAIGGSGVDTITGNDAANQLTGNGGNDVLNGGLGVDTANYASPTSFDSWHRNLDGSWTVFTPGEGTDTLSGVEFAHFSDRDVFLARAQETFTGDGASDLFLRNSAGTLSVWFLNGASITGAGAGSIGGAWSTLGYGDLNGDGRDDILWRDTSGNLSLWEMNGAAVTGVGLGNVSTSWNVAGVGDLNGDLVDDVLWRNGAGDMSIWFQDANGGHTGASLGNVDPSWVIEAFGDFNGDGKQDFLWRNTVSGDMSLWFMNGTSVTGGQFAHVGQPWQVEGTGDFNGDGRDDVVWRNAVTGDMSIWMMNGQTLVSQPGYSIGTDWHIAAIGDYNGDGKDDLIWWNDNGALVEWLMNGGTITSSLSPGSLDHDWIINPGG